MLDILQPSGRRPRRTTCSWKDDVRVNPEPRGRMTITDHGDALVLAGAIDAAAALHELPTRARSGRLVLDLAAITFINSLGVRDWIRMQATAQKGALDVELRRVA